MDQVPVYIGKSGDLVRCYRCLTNRQTTEDRATKLLYSIQFKLSHAIKDIIFVAIAAFLFQTNTVCHQNITTFIGFESFDKLHQQKSKHQMMMIQAGLSHLKLQAYSGRQVSGSEEGSKKLTHLSLNFMSDKR